MPATLNGKKDEMQRRGEPIYVDIYDKVLDKGVEVSQNWGELRVTERQRLVGTAFDGAVLDTQFWNTTTQSGASASMANGEVVISTGTSGNGYAKVQSARSARYIAACPHAARFQCKIGDAGGANNIRRWGAFTTQNGCFFELNDTTLKVVTRCSGVDTAVSPSSWNGAPIASLGTSLHTFEIYFNTKTVYFAIDDVVIHRKSATTDPWTASYHLPAAMENVNSGGESTDHVIYVRTASIHRFGTPKSRPKYASITSNGTMVCKWGPGTLERVVIATPGATGNTVTIYDNVSGAGNQITNILADAFTNAASLTYDVDFYSGLTVVVATGTPGSTTIIYD